MKLIIIALLTLTASNALASGSVTVEGDKAKNLVRLFEAAGLSPIPFFEGFTNFDAAEETTSFGTFKLANVSCRANEYYGTCHFNVVSESGVLGSKVTVGGPNPDRKSEEVANSIRVRLAEALGLRRSETVNQVDVYRIECSYTVGDKGHRTDRCKIDVN